MQSILTIAGQWQQTQEMSELLNLMAAAATKLLAAERASIFLWDKSSHTLVGRPALGVDQDAENVMLCCEAGLQVQETSIEEFLARPGAAAALLRSLPSAMDVSKLRTTRRPES